MRSRSRNVCSFLALTIAMGTGGAYAADTVFSRPTSSTARKVKAADIAGAAVTNSKLGPNSVGSGKIIGRRRSPTPTSLN